jgi:hypothetical protein
MVKVVIASERSEFGKDHPIPSTYEDLSQYWMNAFMNNGTITKVKTAERVY